MVFRRFRGPKNGATGVLARQISTVNMSFDSVGYNYLCYFLNYRIPKLEENMFRVNGTV